MQNSKPLGKDRHHRPDGPRRKNDVSNIFLRTSKNANVPAKLNRLQKKKHTHTHTFLGTWTLKASECKQLACGRSGGSPMAKSQSQKSVKVVTSRSLGFRS